MKINVKFVFIDGSEKIIYLNDVTFREFANQACENKFVCFDDLTIHMEQVLYFEKV